MKSVILSAIAIAATFGSALAETNNAARPSPRVSRDKLLQIMRKQSMRKNGGYVRKPNSAKGTFLILNAQKRVVDAQLNPAVEMIDKWIHARVAIKPHADSVSLENIRSLIDNNGGTLGVAIVENDHCPSLLTAPESGWAMINIRKLASDGPSDKVLAERIRKEVIRAFAFITGGAYATRGDFLMRDVVKPSDLDAFGTEMFGVELVTLLPKSAPLYGLTPWYQTTYRAACEEGWAPAPTNEFQTAIWNEVHALPSDPIKIKYDPKRDK